MWFLYKRSTHILRCKNTVEVGSVTHSFLPAMAVSTFFPLTPGAASCQTLR